MEDSQTLISPTDLVGDRVRGLQEYAPEPLGETAQRLGLPPESLIKADANENPYGPTPAALRALAAYDSYHRYPDPVSRRLAARIAEYVGVPQEHILVANGSDELIDLILRLFRPGRNGGGIAEIIDCPPTFGMYSFYGATNDMSVVSVPRLEDYQLDMQGIAAICSDQRPRILFAASPNNPDGRLLDSDSLNALLGLPLLVVLDEAYVEFAACSRSTWVPERENLIVLRTFSKWAGLAGLRVGYGIFPSALMPSLWRVKSPYNVNGPAQTAALATLESADEALARVRRIVSDREAFYLRLEGISGLRVFPSQANYIMCTLQSGTLAELKEHMEARGILLRYYGQGRLESTLRISVDTPERNETIACALAEFVAGARTR